MSEPTIAKERNHMAERSLQVVDQSTGVITNAAEWNAAREQFIRETYCGGAPSAEADVFITICKRRGLAPEERQVYLTERAGKWTIQTGIDGYRLIADRTGLYAGSDEPLFIGATPEGYPEQASVTVYKMVGGQPRPFTGTAFWSEYFPGDKQGFMWKKMPRTMLAKCAEALALRKAFPADLSAIYTAEEMEQAGPATTIAEKPRAARPKAVSAKTEVVDYDNMTDQDYSNQVSAALAAQDGPRYTELVKAAGGKRGRWMVLIDCAGSEKEIDWVTKKSVSNPDVTDEMQDEIEAVAEQRKSQLGIK